MERSFLEKKDRLIGQYTGFFLVKYKNLKRILNEKGIKKDILI